jgi:hypothetical protein
LTLTAFLQVNPHIAFDGQRHAGLSSRHICAGHRRFPAFQPTWVVDNGSSHAGQASIDRMKETWPSAELVHLPIHASWLNQVEIYFSILQRKAIKPGNFRDLDHLAERVLSFQDRYNLTAAPFKWNYSRDDLNKLIRRIADHDTPQAA